MWLAPSPRPLLLRHRTYGWCGLWVLTVRVVSTGRGAAGASALYTLVAPYPNCNVHLCLS